MISYIFKNKGKFVVLAFSHFCLPQDYIQGNNNVQFKLFESFATIYPSQPYEFKQYFYLQRNCGSYLWVKVSWKIRKTCFDWVWEYFAAFYAKQGLLIQTLICKTLFTLNFSQNLNLFGKIQYFNIARFSKIFLFAKIGHLKKIYLKDEDFGVARTRECGSD